MINIVLLHGMKVNVFQSQKCPCMLVTIATLISKLTVMSTSWTLYNINNSCYFLDFSLNGIEYYVNV